MTNEIYIMSESDQLWRNKLIKKTAKATRLPIPRVMMLTWTNFEKPNIIRTPTGRGVEIDAALAMAIDRLPRQSKWMFSMTPFPPLIPDEYLDPAREFHRATEKAAEIGHFLSESILTFKGECASIDSNRESKTLSEIEN